MSGMPPHLGDFALADVHHSNSGKLYPISGGGHTHELPLVGAAPGEALSDRLPSAITSSMVEVSALKDPRPLIEIEAVPVIE